MRPLAGVKLFLVIGACTVYFISFAQAAPFVYSSYFVKETFAANTMVGPVLLANLSKEEAVQRIAEKVNQWRDSVNIKIAYQEKTETIPLSLFSFQVEKSVDQAVDGQASPLIVQMNGESLSPFIEKLVAPALLSSLNRKQLEKDIAAVASQLPANPPAIDLARYVDSQKTAETMQVSEAVISDLGKQRAEITAWIADHPTIEVKGKSVFSLTAYLQGSLSPDGMSLLASAIYQAVLPTNFTIVERHTSRSLPNGIPIGYEAKVDKENRDFSFYNPNINSYTLKFQQTGSGFRVTLMGLPFAYKYVIKVGDIEYFAPKTIVQYSSRFKPNERQMKQQGQQGMLVKVKKEVYDETNQLIEAKEVSEDFYPPVYAIEVRGLELGDDLPQDAADQGANGALQSGQQQQPANEKEQEQTENSQNPSEQTPKTADEQNENTPYEK
ncbi:hypothetical protein B6A27_10985 [Anoxybacillus sp. UARK-01]|uniref:VanW family protein n=1 Tax=Anoxybacillus sp. UARK-01 TaxID=1895648 RepID=UPI0009BA365F|nr:VanW family protein [Anoxybacillus sp. UARK-01]OQM45706.1 hypothetical protein B6A27_10985 [Anoxybacillus sp. UARK-01]